MSDFLADVVAQVREWDAGRERSLQKAIGWSQVAGCRRYMGYRMTGEWESDNTDTWRADVGTALHAWLQDIRRKAAEEAGERVEFEVQTVYSGVPGHADEVNYTTATVTDYKFPSLSSAAVWDDPQVLDEKFIQVQGYAAGLAGELSDKHLSVRLLMCPVDGTFEDWRCFERPFDKTVADAAVERVIEVETGVGMDMELPRDKPRWWCDKFCEFATTCRPPMYENGDDELPEIDDPELGAAVERYGQAKEIESEAVAAKKLVAPLIRGLRGRARGWKVTTASSSVDWRPDMDAIRADYAESGLELPMAGRPKAGALNITRIKE